LTILILVSALFSGCFEESKPTEESSYLSDNQPPIGVISAPTQAYFDEEIDLSASASYDEDGEIVSYIWYFGDDETAEGVMVKHNYKFENNFTIDYPLIYSISLLVQDNDGTITAKSRQIKIYPKEYKFYLNSQGLSIEEPSSDNDRIRGTGLSKFSSPQVIIYDLAQPIMIRNCKWNAVIHLSKPLFSIANKISLIFYDNGGNEIAKKDEKLGPNTLWKEKTVKLQGTFDPETEFKTIKLEVYGFSIRQEIKILYGGEEASYICFDFTT